MIYPNIMPASVLAESAVAGSADATNAFRPPRVEYLATLSRHSAAVNVVRFSPNGQCGFQLLRRSGVRVARRAGCQMTPLPPLSSLARKPPAKGEHVLGDGGVLLSGPLLNLPPLFDLHRNLINPILPHDIC